jgi:hypothetical protein
MRSEVLPFYAQPLDITDIILERLNKSVPSIKVPDPGKQ